MAAFVLTGQYGLESPFDWSMERDDEGNHTYLVTYIVAVDNKFDGPLHASVATGLPAIGDYYDVGDDINTYALRTPFVRIKIHERKAGDPTVLWQVQVKFTTIPFDLCHDDTSSNPLIAPDRVSGSFVKYTKEIVKDRNGDVLKYSNQQLIQGPLAEFDFNRPTIRVSQNAGTLGLATFTALMDVVNSSTLWGLPPRTIKLSSAEWERIILTTGVGVCTYYYERTFDFDIDFTTFDRVVPNAGTMVLRGKYNDKGVWTNIDIDDAPPKSSDPTHFIRYEDIHGNPGRVLLDLDGNPHTDGDNPIKIDIEHYEEADLGTLLVLPTSF